MAKEINLDAFADKIADKLLAAKQQAREAGEDVGEEFVKGVVKGIQQHSKEAKSEITKIFEDFNKTTNSFKSRKSVTQAEWTRVLGLSKELMKSERYADSVREKLSDISVTFKNGVNVSGLEKVLAEFEKVGGLVESVQWAEAGKNYRKKPSTKKPVEKKPKVETPAIQADPAPKVKKEAKQIEELEQRYRSLIQAMQEWKKLSEDVKSIKQAKNASDLRKQVLNLVSQISSDTAHIIGPGFGDAFARGFKNVRTQDILAQIDWINNADIMGGITEQLNALTNIDLKNFNLSDILSLHDKNRTSTTWQLREFYDILKQIAQLQGQMDSPIKETTEALHEQASAAESAAQAQEKLNNAQKQSALSDKEVEHALDVKAKYTGAKLQGKSDFISAIKDEWGRGNKAVSAKLFEQYKARFPGGTYDPSTDKSFGADWVDNYNKYLEQANRHIAELDKRLGGVVGGVVEIQGEFKKLSEIIAESKNAALSGIDLNNSKFIQTDKYDYTDSDITDMKTHIESVRKEADQLKDEALAAKQAFDEVSNIRSEYFGVSLRRKTGWNNKTKSEYDAGKKSDWQSAIKSAWDQGNKPLAAKLYEQYQANFPKGSFDPSKQARFGEDWVNNYAKYLEQANRHIVELDTMLRNMGAEYGKYIAYFELDSFANENATRLERIKQEGKLVGEVVRSDLDSRKEVAHNKYATGDQVIAQENLNKAVAEYNRRQAVANDLLEFRNEMIEALDDDSKEYLFEGYKTPADAIQDASGKYSDARLDADRFAITELEEAIRVARELGIEIDEAYTVPDDKKNKIVNDILMRQRRFVMNNAKAGTPEKSQQIWDAAITQQNEYQQELAETEQAVERVSAAESNIIYHAGDLSNPSKTQKTYPLGNVRPSKDGVVFSGFTGLYTTEDVGEFWGNEWSGAPISTIDASQYKLFDASSDAVASAVKVFFDNLNGTIYGYVDDFTTGAAKRLTDVKTVDELWADFNEIFKSANIGFETFEAFIKRAQGLVYGKNFMEIYDLPDIDEGIVKTGEDNVLQGASKEVFNSDSFQTQLLKMLGFEGIDLRGTKFNGTYTGGTVIFDVKPESIQTTNEKWSDVMARNGYRVDEVALAHEEKRRQLAFDTAKAYSKMAEESHKVDAPPIVEEATSKELQDTFDIIQQGESVTAKFETTANTVHEALRKMRDALPEDRQAWGAYIDNMLASDDDKAIDTFKSMSGSIGDHSELYKMDNLGDGRVAVTFSGIYDKLIEGENKYQQELEETARIQKERDGQLFAYSDAAIALFGDNKYDSVAFEDKNNLYESFANKIAEGSISASDAMDQLYLSMEALRKQSESMPDDVIESFGGDSEQVAETVSQLKKLSSVDATRIFDSVDLKAFLEMFNIDKSNFATFRTLFEELMQITKAMSDGVDVGNAFDMKMAEITDAVMRLGGHMVDLDDGGYVTMIQDFYKHMSNTKIQFNDTIKAEYTKDQWKSLYGTYKNRLTADVTKGIPVDSLYQELNDKWPGLFPESENQQADFKLIIEKLDEARKLQANNWKVLQGFVSSDGDSIQGSVDDLYEKMSDALFVSKEIEATKVESDVDKNLDSIKQATEEQSDDLEQQIAAAEQAKENLDKAFQNVKSASSRAVLKGQTKADFEDFARQIANDSGMELGTVAVSRDEMDQMRIASIKLLNKELAQSITYTYDIQENAEGVNEAFLRSSYAIGDANKALENARKREEQDAKKKLQNDTWLYAQRGKLDTQQRRYTDPDRGIDGKLSIMSTETSLADDAEHTIESLANHIRENIKKSLSDGLTDEVKRKIISDLEILENEIKVRQSETYSSTTMKSSQFETNKKAYQEYMKAFTARAQKSGVFPQMAKTISDLNNELNSVSDAKGFSQFVDNFKIARNKLQAEIGELSRDTKMLQSQLSAFSNEEKAYNKIFANIRAIGEDNIGDGFAQKISAYQDATVDLRKAMDNLKANPEDSDHSLHKAFDDAAFKVKNARVEIEGILKESQKLDQVMANMEVFDKEKLDPSELKNLQQAMLSFASSVEDGVFKFKGFNKAGTEMYGTLEQSSGAIKNVTVALKQSSDQLFMYGTNANRADNEWEEFKNTLASGTKNLVGMYVGFQEGVQAIRSGVEAVKQIDLAMTELKKVTDETDDSYREFLEDAGRTSAVIGSTVSDFAEASATFARLGYSLDEASSMAETAIVYKNVADGLDTVEESSESIISTMMAFGIEASDTMGIIDRFNAVGKIYADYKVA